ncbi:MAG: 3-phosphoshikimate 1-carboxyvinyltransferase [Planctomycetes bacterium ADurb.Bin126]|nr:MAG: 3-phosphoshikimate 1-carboxyvinyltransferase [Planctomycetes bacterium ADurb.Bin126]
MEREITLKVAIQPSHNLHGQVRCPPNKSHSFRALIMAALAEGTSLIHDPAISNDWMRGVEALEMFGCEAHPKAEKTWSVAGRGGSLQVPDDVVDCGNSGIILRFFMALAASCEGYTVFSGDHSLRHIRLCQPLIDALNSLGAWAVSTKGDGHAPVVVRGRLRGGRAEIDGFDSQPVSALLIASALADAPTELTVRRAGEKPWVGVTLDWLNRCGVEFSNENFERYRIRGRNRWKAFECQIPLDWSAALYPIAAAVLTRDSEVRLPGMDFNDSQGDKAVVDVLRSMGADIRIEGDLVTARSSRLTGRTIDCNDFIDQFMLLAVVGACADGQTVLTNAEVCRHKECDRITEMAKALRAMGADVEERPDGLAIRRSRLRGADLDSRSDHRMVMTMAVAGLVADGATTISDTECVKKTFPNFIEQMQALGCDMQKQ